MNGLVYDLEIVKGIPLGHKEEGVEYCDGWTDYANMGISVLCAYDFVSKSFRVFCQDNLQEFFELAAQRDPLIGFNSVGFDNNVLSCFGTLPEGKDYYDILQEIYRTVGKRFKGSGLDAICTLNGLGSKSGNGALAPVQWQRGQIGSVIDYCLRDVRLTRDLFVLSQKAIIKTPKGNLSLRKVDDAD